MDFSLTESQQELAALTRRILTDQVSQDRLKAVESGAPWFDRELWAALGQAGVLAAAAPESLGGGGLDLLEQCSVLIELGRAVAAVPYLSSVVACASAIGYFGTDEQRARWGRPAVEGSIVLAAALTEDLTDTPETPTLRARADGAGWRLTGTKSVVLGGGLADAFLVPAMTDDGVAIFLVAASAAGLTITQETFVDGDTVASLDLADVAVDAGDRFGNDDVLHWLLARMTIGTCAHQLGVLERAVELTAEYARERTQFGRPIGSFQAVAQRLADAFIDVEAVRLTMWEAAWRVASALPGIEPIATAKFWASDAGHRVAHTAVHVHGGAGIDVDAPTHRYFVAAKRNEFVLGSATAQLRVLGAELAATPA